MITESSSFKMGHEYDVIVPRRETAYPIPGSDWDYLKTKVSRVSTPGLIHHTVGSAFLGVAGSAFVAALTLPDTTEQGPAVIRVVVWAVFVVTCVCGAVTLWYAHKERSRDTDWKKDVIEEMDRMEQKYKPEDTTTTDSDVASK